MLAFLVAPILVGAATLPLDIVKGGAINSEIAARAEIGTPKFINFPEGSNKPAQIKAALSNAVTFASTVQMNQGKLQQLVIKWFRDPNLDEDAFGVMSNIVLKADTFDMITFDAKDFSGLCGNVLAYINGRSTHTPTIHVCDRAYEAPNFSTITCESLGTKLSAKMSSLGDILLHELTHWDDIGKNVVGQSIVDEEYGPLKCYKPKKGVLDARHNADSYRWFALDTYWTIQCKKDITVGYDKADDNQNYPVELCEKEKCTIK